MGDNGSGDFRTPWNNQKNYFKFGRNYRHQFNPPEDLTKFHVYNASSSSFRVYIQGSIMTKKVQQMGV